MKYHLKIILAAVTVLFVTAVSATHADLVVNISSNGASYFFDPADPQTASFDHQSGSIGDVLFEDHFLFRWQDDSGFGSETFVASLGALTTGQVQYQGTTNSGDTAVSEWQIWGGLLQPVHLYTVTMTNTISTQNGMAILDYQFDVSNENGTAGSAFALFHFADYDIDPFATNSATAGFVGSDVEIDMTGDETSTGMIGFLADRFELREVGVGNRITADILASTMYNLDNDPTFLNMVDINAAIQWDRFQAGTGGGTVTMFAQAFIIPEPGLLPMLALGLICGCVSRRRRI